MGVAQGDCVGWEAVTGCHTIYIILAFEAIVNVLYFERAIGTHPLMT